jgi:HAE1 family hydrophobic/amphiphilic exporter-1/multidrug efflux pump
VGAHELDGGAGAGDETAGAGEGFGEAAANDVRDKVSQAIKDLPQDIDSQPIVSKADANSEAIISMTVQSDSRNALELSDYAENVIGQHLETIPGVSGIQIW